MSDASRHAMHYVLEGTYGTTPANPAFKRLRHTGATLGVQRGSLQSQELRADRQIAHFRLGSITTGGDASGELSFASYDDLLQAVCLGTWTARDPFAANTLSMDGADNSINDSAEGFLEYGFIVGQRIAISGFTSVGNNVNARIVSITAGKIIFTNLDGSEPSTLTNEAEGDNVEIEPHQDELLAGTTRRSFTILRHFTDITAAGAGEPYHTFKGVEFNSLAVTIDPNAIVGCTFGTMGREPATSNNAPAGATFADAPATAPLDAFTGEIKLNGVAVGVVSAVNFTLENGLEVRPVVGSKYGLRPSIGRSNLTGQVTVYFEDSSFVKKFYDEADSSLLLEFPDGEGNFYVIEILRFKFTGAQPDVAGQGSITLALPFQAYMDAVLENNIRIRRHAAA